MQSVYVYRNNKELSIEVYNNLLSILKKMNFTLRKDYDASLDLIICIGGDGTFLSFIHRLGFPSAPVISINTGHLGFFQEAMPDEAEHILDCFINGDYKIQTIKTIEAHIETAKDTYVRNGINEVLIRGPFSHVSQYRVSIKDTQIQDFSGDGILVSTPVGSTAYNYSLGGALVSPDLDVLQITPVAPMNTNAYRCFHSSILLPADETITVSGMGRSENGTVMLSFDGRTHEFTNVRQIRIKQSDKDIHLVRFADYDYWKKLKSKLI